MIDCSLYSGVSRPGTLRICFFFLYSEGLNTVDLVCLGGILNLLLEKQGAWQTLETLSFSLQVAMVIGNLLFKELRAFLSLQIHLLSGRFGISN